MTSGKGPYAWRGAGEYCAQCPEGGSVCLGGVAQTQAASGYWLYQSRVSDPESAAAPTSTVAFVQCTPIDACVQGNLCAFGYEGDLVREWLLRLCVLFAVCPCV